mgnify:CR=1 FL=1
MSDELMHEPDAAQVILPPGFLKNPVHLLAFGFGSGAAPRAPRGAPAPTAAARPLGGRGVCWLRQRRCRWRFPGR